MKKIRLKSFLKSIVNFFLFEIAFGKEKEWKDGKYVETGKDKIINNTKPAWTLKPADLKDEDYLEVLQGIVSDRR